ncbi:hypothetical protein HSX11_00945 [Oxalobacteraceae bacterium]|nr:hypothetical protein [Oxalobacteraceae bacterium]
MKHFSMPPSLRRAGLFVAAAALIIHSMPATAASSIQGALLAQGADVIEAYVNGRYVGRAASAGIRVAVDAALVAGDNVIALNATRGSSAAPFVLAQLSGQFGRTGSGTQWRTLAWPGAAPRDEHGDWTSVGFNDASWKAAVVKTAGLPSGFPQDGPAAPIWSASDADSKVLFRLNLYLPKDYDASKPQGYGRAVTGGKGGTVVRVSTPEQLEYELCRSRDSGGKCSDHQARIIELAGVIDYRRSKGNETVTACAVKQCAAPAQSEYIVDRFGACAGKPTFSASIDAAGNQPLLVGSNKTLLGVGRHPTLRGRGLTLRGGVSNIVIRNLSISDINAQYVWGGDALTMDDVDRVWIDHNYFGHIGRQMIVSGFGKASNVTISWNEFDGLTEYSATCDGTHYWGMLHLGAADTISMVNNFIHDTAGRMPHAGGMNNATVAMHIANNLFLRIAGHAANPLSQSAKLMMEGNHFNRVATPVQISPDNPGLAFAPVAPIGASTAENCRARLGRDCQPNLATPMPAKGAAAFPLDGAVLQLFGSQTAAMVLPYPAEKVTAAVRNLAGVRHVE